MKLKKFLITSIVVIGLFASSVMTLAAPRADIKYVETYLGEGLWQYNYTFTSTGDKALYSVWFDFSQFANVTGETLPTGWNGTVWEGTNYTKYLDTFSTDLIYDIPAGGSLSGFNFTINYQAGNIPYTAYFSDRSVISGTTAIGPEPISSVLFIAGGATLAARRFFRRKK